MTDWGHNVDDLVRLYERPEFYSDAEIQGSIMQLLAHIPNQVAAAKELAGLGPVKDVFRVGVDEEDD